MHPVLSGVGIAYLSLDTVGLDSLSGLYRLGDKEKLEGEFHFGLPFDETDVLGGDNGTVGHVCNTIHLIIAWKNT